MRRLASIQPLGHEDCLARLATTTTGRIAGCQAALPVIFPVRFVLVPGALVFSLPPGSPMWVATESHVVAFEADSGTDRSDECWSVQVQGVCHETASAVNCDLLEDLPLPRWHSSGGADHLMVLALDRVSGETITWGLAEPSDPTMPGQSGSRES